MASGIVDCTGKTIHVGDKVKTEHGDIIEVCGGLVSEHKLFNAEKCELVAHDTPITNTGHVEGAKDLQAARAAGVKPPKIVSDCIVWGT
jgi:hypothetical protein